MRSFANGSDDQRKLVIIIADTLIRGVSVLAGEEVTEVDAADASTLVMYSKAVYFTPQVTALTLEDMAAVAAQSRAELIAKIAAAKSVQELEELLSEDPEIVAAYEKRLVEIEGLEAADTAKAELLGKIASAETIDAVNAFLPLVGDDVEILEALHKRSAELLPPQ